MVTCHVRDVLVGEEQTLVQRVRAGRPHHFAFHTLQPDRPYTAWLSGVVGEEHHRAAFRTLVSGGCGPSTLAMALVPAVALSMSHMHALCTPSPCEREASSGHDLGESRIGLDIGGQASMRSPSYRGNHVMGVRCEPEWCSVVCC